MPGSREETWVNIYFPKPDFTVFQKTITYILYYNIYMYVYTYIHTHTLAYPAEKPHVSQSEPALDLASGNQMWQLWLAYRGCCQLMPFSLNLSYHKIHYKRGLTKAFCYHYSDRKLWMGLKKRWCLKSILWIQDWDVSWRWIYGMWWKCCPSEVEFAWL